jgi:hypothetical protein
MANDIRLSGLQTSFRSESDIRFNYYDLNKIVAASNAVNVGPLAVFYSGDMGGSWSQSSLPEQAGDEFQGDPAVDWTSDGTAWALCVGLLNPTLGNTVRCFKSVNNGQTWTFDAIISGTQNNVDKPMLWVDHCPTSPHKDNIYALWWNNGPTYVARRLGPGGTWQAPLQISGAETTGGSDGGDIKTNTHGDVFAFWPSETEKTVNIAKSTDGGASFNALGGNIKIADTFGSFLFGIPAQDTRQVLLYISGGAYKTATVDFVYAVWMDLEGGTGCNAVSDEPGSDVTSACKTRIWFSRSVNGGVIWDAPKMLNDQSSLNDQFFPRMVVDETSGDIVVIYYDTVADPGRLKTDIWMQSSNDNGQSWSSAALITSSETDETVAGVNGNQYGDYVGLTGYAGQYFASWTDRRNGLQEEIWGAPLSLIPRAATFVLHKDHYGQDETDSWRLSPTGPVFTGTISLQVTGYTARELGITGPASKSLAPPIAFSPSTGVTSSCSSLTSTDPTFSPDLLQIFWFNYDVNFGPTDDAFTSFAGQSEQVVITTTFNALPMASAFLTFTKQPDPFIQQGAQTWWLSSDIRLVQVAEGDTAFGVPMQNNDPLTFLANLTAALELGQGSAGGQVFDQNIDEEQEMITTAPQAMRGGQLVNVYNFAIARVHYRGNVQPANNVRVFFRLFAANSTDTSFNPSTTFSRDPSTYPVAPANFGQHVTPTPGIVSGNYVTLPCYGVARQDVTQAGAPNSLPPLQYDGFNDRNLPATGVSQKDFYYGAFLDINQATPALPQTPPAGNNNGPWPTPMPGNPILSPTDVFTRNDHNCIVAEIAFDPDSINTGTEPWNSDKFAQRNISWSPVANPGLEASRMALQNFEVRPTPSGIHIGQMPDEIMIDWKGVPVGQSAEVYLPEVSAAAVIAAANRLYKTHRLSIVDANTIGCVTGGMSFIPLPPGTGNGLNFAGLMAVTLPYGIKKGSLYKVIVMQLTNAEGVLPYLPRQEEDEAANNGKDRIARWRIVHGIFQINIPVSTKELMLEKEEIRLSIFRKIGESIQVHNRWYPVFERYLKLLAGKVTALGGDPAKIKPSTNGYDGLPGRFIDPKPFKEDRECFTGKILGISFDRYGDFDGFELNTEAGNVRFFSREKEVKELVERAWHDRLRITVCPEHGEPHRPASFFVHEPPVDF